MKFNGITRTYGDKEIFRDFSVDFADGSVTAIMGPSGCGKTTLLGEIAARSNLSPVSFVFQEPRLIPWKTAMQNVTIALTGDGKERKARALRYLERVGLGDRGDSYPENLSGGERQRVAIARAFAVRSPLLLMDEPFQSQDSRTKSGLIALFNELRIDERRTIVVVTHDVRETMTIADRAIVISGRPASIALDLAVTDTLEIAIASILAPEEHQ
jgi:NitT/TauT family transport system ATP-binding protein